MADYRADPEKMMEGSRQVRSLAEIVGQYAQDVRSVERNLQIRLQYSSSSRFPD